jgi:hypothetical protein
MKSFEGVQFLALAAALITTISPYQGGKTLETMLITSEEDKTCVPTASQLKDLLAGLKDRCAQSRFPETVVYCGNILMDLSSPSETKTFWKECDCLPRPGHDRETLHSVFEGQKYIYNRSSFR